MVQDGVSAGAININNNDDDRQPGAGADGGPMMMATFRAPVVPENMLTPIPIVPSVSEAFHITSESHLNATSNINNVDFAAYPA